MPNATQEIIETRALVVQGADAHLHVELTQDVDAPHQLQLQIEGNSALSLVGTGGRARGSVSFELMDPEGVRALGEALVALADHADARGMLDDLRKQGRT